MGKKAAPKLAMEAKNHMENHVTFSFSAGLGMVVSIGCVNFCFAGEGRTDSQTL